MTVWEIGAKSTQVGKTTFLQPSTEKDLDKSGLKLNLDKSNWHARRIGEWLGFIINAILNGFSSS